MNSVKQNIGFFLMLFIWLMAMILPVDCYADGDADNPADVEYASTGTLVAAGLESAGYKAQAIVLEDLGKMLTGLGALFFITAALCACITLVLSGKYDTAMWFVIGPGLLFFLIKTTEVGSGVEWQYGSGEAKASALIKDVEIAPQNDQVAWVKNDEGGAKVSWFFHEFNLFISALMRSMIDVISDQAMLNKVKFTVRQQVYEDVINARIGSPDLVTFTQYTMASCAKEMDASRILALGERDKAYRKSPEYRKARADYVRLYDANFENKPLRNGPLTRYINQMQDAASAGEFNIILKDIYKTSVEESKPFGFWDEYIKKAFGDEKYQSLLNDKTLAFMHNKISCMQLWALMGAGLYKEGNGYLNTKMTEKLNPDEETAIKEIVNDLAVKLENKPRYVFNPETLNYDATENTGEIVVEQTTADAKLSLVPVIVGAYMLRKAQADGTNSKIISSFAEHSGVVPTASTFDPTGATVYSDKEMYQFGHLIINHIISQRKKHEMFTFAMMAPYVQGIMLYSLALAFPFVCLAVLLPGQANVFFSWCALWAWLKSWDVGWSLVMIIDNVLWQLMPHSGYFSLENADLLEPITMMDHAFYGDPGYNMSNYYTLIALLITLVPVIMARLVIGAKAAGLSAFVEKFNSVGEGMGKAAESRIKARLSNEVNTLRYNYESKLVSDIYHNNVGSYLSTIPGLNRINQHYDDIRKEFKNDKEAAETYLMGSFASMVVPGAGSFGVGAALAQNERKQTQGRNEVRQEVLQKTKQADMQLQEFMMNTPVARQFEQLRAMSNGRAEPFGYKEFGNDLVANPGVDQVIAESKIGETAVKINTESFMGGLPFIGKWFK